MLSKQGKKLRIFINETDKYKGKVLYEWIVLQAKEHNMAGATVTRAIEGLGPTHHIHTAKILRLSMDMPLVIEIIDSAEKIESFLSLIDDAVKKGIATIEDVTIHFYRPGNES